MTSASGIQYGSGFRFGAAYQIDQTTGRLKGTSVSVPYTGEMFVGAKAWNLTVPKQRRIFHINADRVGAADFLPPTEAGSGTLAVGADNQVLDSILTGNKRVTSGDASFISELTSNQGFEPLIALLFWQQSLDSSNRLRKWRAFLIPRAKAIPMTSGFADKEIDGNYDILMTPSSFNIFGAAITDVIDGATDAQWMKAMTTGRPALAAFVGNGYTVDFTLQTNYGGVVTAAPTISTTSVIVYKNGVKLSSGITVTTTKVTFTSAPLSTDDISIFWEY